MVRHTLSVFLRHYALKGLKESKNKIVLNCTDEVKHKLKLSKCNWSEADTII